MKRRDFFRSLAIGSLMGTAVSLFIKAYRSGEDCIGDGKCRTCFSLKKCELPLAKDYRSRKGGHQHG